MNRIKELAEKYNISSSYIDKIGQAHQTSDEVRKFFLEAMFGEKLSENLIEKKLAEKAREKILPEVISFYDDEEIILTPNINGNYHLSLIDENDQIVWQKEINGERQTEISGISVGYYTILLKQGENCHKSFLIYAPQFCYQPQFLKNKEHLSGVSVMLYALHSQNSMGIGDFGDLAEIIKLTAQNGGDIIGLNPLGVMSYASITDINKADVSPYRTLSRLFINYAYLDLRSEPDFIHSETVAEFMNKKETVALLEKLNTAEMVQYKEVLTLKRNILELMYEHFLQNADADRKLKFEKYKEEKGITLFNLGLFETLLEKMYPTAFWRKWPAGFSDITSKETADFAQKHQKQINFFAYCHWLADMQVKNLQKLALSLGMKIGLYTDMPIGAASNGSEVWENPDAYVLDCIIGAPADPMRPRGQSWGFMPYHPEELVKQHYAPFIKLVRENMKFSGALRIDHAMGLRRLFWGFFKKDTPVVQGAYVYYNIKDLTAIISIESNRNKCLVIGEDLGTVPEGFREYMAQHGLLSYKVFYRQKEKSGDFVPPENYQYLSLAQTSTHDQATAYGFWANEDIEVFNECNLYVNDQQYKDNLCGRKKDRENMLKTLLQNNIVSDVDDTFEKSIEEGTPIPKDINVYVTKFGARTNSSLFLVRLCDIYKQKKLDNAPGTIFEYSNWRYKLNVSIEDISEGKEFASNMKLIKDNRPRHSEKE
ncbi:MAG: 4-alpha-glucanotransferase [Alphaproteobacteria bacterium]|nr:4-alpha-glucanotransferase [Alphaproteobacteria bacterium]